MLPLAAALGPLASMGSSAAGSMMSVFSSALAPLAGSVLQKVITVLVFIILASVVVLGYMIFVHTPPRPWKLSHVGEETANEIVEMTYEMVLRIEDEYGDDIKAWLEGERAANTHVFKKIVDEWHLRADESYITRTFVLANTVLAEDDDSEGRGLVGGGAGCKDCTPSGSSSCERPREIDVTLKDREVVAKDFDEDVFDECPRLGKPPCYNSGRSVRRRTNDLFFGTPPPLDPASLRSDFEVWFNLRDNDPVKPVMEADKPMLRSIENVELFIASLPWFMRHVQARYAVFRYCTPEEIVASHEWITGDLDDPKKKPMFIRKYGVFKGFKDDRDDLLCKISRSSVIIDLTRDDIFEAVIDDPVLVRAIILKTDVKQSDDIDNLAEWKVKVLARLRGISDKDDPLYFAGCAMRLLDAAGSDMDEARTRVTEANMGAARQKLRDASADFANAIDKLILLKEITDTRLNFVSISAYPALEKRKSAWDDILDLVNYDDEDIEDAYRAVETINKRDVLERCSTDPGDDSDRVSLLERDYRRYINLVHAVVYTGTYLVESKKYANIYHLNREVAKRFYEIVYDDLRCAYLNKFTYKPHVSETGLVYNVQSLPEFAFSFWQWSVRAQSLLEGLKNLIDSASEACGF